MRSLKRCSTNLSNLKICTSLHACNNIQRKAQDIGGSSRGRKTWKLSPYRLQRRRRGLNLFHASVYFRTKPTACSVVPGGGEEVGWWVRVWGLLTPEQLVEGGGGLRGMATLGCGEGREGWWSRDRQPRGRRSPAVLEGHTLICGHWMMIPRPRVLTDDNFFLVPAE